MNHSKPENSPLGKKSQYASEYDPTLLYPIARKINRDAIGVPQQLPFRGVDIWTAFEISCLNSKGKPMIAIGEIVIPCHSPNIVESKSLKLYLNSFSQMRLESEDHLRRIIERDLSAGFGAEVSVKLIPPKEFHLLQIGDFDGICLDDLDIEVDNYRIDPSTLQSDSSRYMEQTLFSHLLKSNCLVTGQPDWLSVSMKYCGPKIDCEGLLKYIISFRNTNEFSEQCIERIYMDLLNYCSPEKLTVYGRSTRRGGLDINPFRSNFEERPFQNIRLARQ